MQKESAGGERVTGMGELTIGIETYCVRDEIDAVVFLHE